MSAWCEAEWESNLVEEAGRRGLVSSRTPIQLAEAVSRVSEAYNRHQHLRSALDPRDVLAARLGFFVPRDVSKAAESLREVLDSGWLAGREQVSILDVGAGLGASTIGVTMALRRAGFTGEVRSEMIDADGAGLDVARALTRRVDGLTATAEVGDASRLPRGRRDIVVIVQTVCELDRQLPEVERVGRHVAWLEHVIDHLLNPGGVLIVVEPALSGPARHLMSVRDGLARAGRRPFAPCTHAAACPMLADPRDWCHERRFVNLPPWLVPVAKSAGLRWESLTFSLLVIRQDRAVRGPAWRVVSDPLESKGRLDRWLCGQPEGEVAVLSRGGRMNRFRTPENAVWDELGRGDTLAPWEGAVASIGREVRLRRWDGGDGGSDAG